MSKRVTASAGEMVDLVDPSSESAGYLNRHWSGHLFTDDYTLLGPDEFRIELLRLESMPDNLETRLILRWNDINKAYNRIGMFVCSSAETEWLRDRSVTPRVVEIDYSACNITDP